MTIAFEGSYVNTLALPNLIVREDARWIHSRSIDTKVMPGNVICDWLLGLRRDKPYEAVSHWPHWGDDGDQSGLLVPP